MSWKVLMETIQKDNPPAHIRRRHGPGRPDISGGDRSGGGHRVEGINRAFDPTP